MQSKIGRNQPCPCGSGKKHKKCCGVTAGTVTNKGLPVINRSPDELEQILERFQAKERIRQEQQGLGRPIVSVKWQGNQVVAVKNRVYFSPSWKTFPDFLSDYLKQILVPEWGNAEIAKPLNERHIILQWYDVYCRYQQEVVKGPDEVYEMKMTGVVCCYLGLAYSLYLLDHNVELQNRLVQRLKNIGNFQGAYYELIIANSLIRSGFKLTLEDETDRASKHCEFAAISKHTGKKYWVEAKMRGVNGLLGKCQLDGTSNAEPTSQLIPHLNKALAKPATDDRLVFIDLNAEGNDKLRPKWIEKAVASLERYENELPVGVTAYVFVTNMPFHRTLHDDVATAILPFGLGMLDFGRPGYYRLSAIYRGKRKHVDAYQIAETLFKYPQIPSTFDGSLSSDVFDKREARIIIGETYFFGDIGEKGLTGTITTAHVNEQEKTVYLGVSATDDKSYILTYPMTDIELSDYKAHPVAYFGKILPVSSKVKDKYELFEWLVECHQKLSRNDLLQRLLSRPDFDEICNLDRDLLLLEYCESLVDSFVANGACLP